MPGLVGSATYERPTTRRPPQVKFYTKALEDNVQRVGASLAAAIILSKVVLLAATAATFPLWSPWAQAAARNLSVVSLTCPACAAVAAMSEVVMLIPCVFAEEGSTRGAVARARVGNRLAERDAAPWREGRVDPGCVPARGGGGRRRG